MRRKEKIKIPRQEKSLWVVSLFVFVSVYDFAEHSITFFYVRILYATRNKIYLQNFMVAKYNFMCVYMRENQRKKNGKSLGGANGKNNTTPSPITCMIKMKHK